MPAGVAGGAGASGLLEPREGSAGGAALAGPDAGRRLGCVAAVSHGADFKIQRVRRSRQPRV
ncbi:hypothetical protein PsYK624_047600 [Phanerochaete sordida]|uniref:Uncharacterized protein n=1 Tax=Phanerochaete sordida TaxID=48140 RepID=A0A9P3LCA5_9APHY|nr:hypothetical protein PsYK624_047600 [Phanerochaete sordida]